MKRIFDILASFFLILLFSPVLIITLLLVFVQDYKSPFYISERVGVKGRLFKMYKIRSMIVNADSSGVSSTSNTDSRITPIGHFIRKFKLDEVSQLINVFTGSMSLVGPRPNVLSEVVEYTSLEKSLLTVKPGITDFASIVFSDEGKILAPYPDPDLAYNQLIRPGKSRLGLFYISKQSLLVDVSVLFITFIAIFAKRFALVLLVSLLEYLNAPQDLLTIASRKEPLRPSYPPGL